MSQENYIAKLLEMEEAIIENVEKIGFSRNHRGVKKYQGTTFEQQ